MAGGISTGRPSRKFRNSFDSEKDLHGQLLDDCKKLCVFLGLPKAVEITKEANIDYRVRGQNRNRTQARADIVVWHGSREYTVIEAKVSRSATVVASAIGQLLLYRSLLVCRQGAEKVNLVLAVDAPVLDEIGHIIYSNELDIFLVSCNDLGATLLGYDPNTVQLQRFVNG